MRKLFFLFLLILCNGYVFSLGNKLYGNLEVYIENFESEEGNVRVQLYNEATGQNFPDKPQYCYKLIVSKIENHKAKVIFDNIPFGNYALSVHHDQNLNIKLDKNILGLPSEGWGLSKNIIPVFKLPSFSDCQFEVNKSVVMIKILVRNHLVPGM